MHGAQDLLEVRATDGRATLVPFVAALVPEVDVAGRRVVVADRPGLVAPYPDELSPAMTLRIDLVTIFPAYFDALDLSLAGKARETGLLDVHVHDLRDWTHDRHRTVDDTPYGGGAGHGDEAGAVGRGPRRPGRRPDGRHARRADPGRAARSPRQLARELGAASTWSSRAGATRASTSGWPTTRRRAFEVLELSIGDYVLNGGEAAALAIIEAVVRLLPGFMGNAESLAEESHEDGLLEAPVYTKPATWRGLDVPVGAAQRRPWRDRAVARRSSRAGVRPSVGRTCCSPSALLEDVAVGRSFPPMPGSC